MKKKFMRILSPITLSVVAVLDIAVVYFAFFAIKKLIAFTTRYAVFFAIMELFAFVVSIIVTKNVLSQGIIFYEDRLEFTSLDDNNIVKYEDIDRIDSQKDNAASLVKNFVDRQSKIIFHLKDDSILTVDIGLTTNKALKKICNEINEQISNADK